MTQTVDDSSATAYFYVLKFYQELNLPIGIIQSSIGDIPVEARTSKASLTSLGEFDKKIHELEELKTTIKSWFDKWSFLVVSRTDEEWENL